MDDFSHYRLATILFSIHRTGERVSDGSPSSLQVLQIHAVIVASNIYSARTIFVLVLHALFIFVGLFRCITDARTPDASLAAHQLSCLGILAELLPGRVL